MRQAIRPWILRWGTLALLGGLSGAALVSGAAVAASAESSAAPGDVVNGSWQHHEVTFSYFGITSLFTCDGLEDHVREILLHLGARKDVKVRASGCPGPYNSPTRSAWVQTDFYTLVPAARADASAIVKARWAPVEMTPRRPYFMGDGDCELIQAMKDLITKNFTLRDVEYRADCVPHELWIDSYVVKGEALRALPMNSNALKG